MWCPPLWSLSTLLSPGCGAVCASSNLSASGTACVRVESLELMKHEIDETNTCMCQLMFKSKNLNYRPFDLDIFGHGPGTTPFSRAIVEKPYLLFWQHLAPAPVGSSADLHSDMWLANVSPCQVQPLPASRILHLARTSTLWHVESSEFLGSPQYVHFSSMYCISGGQWWP